MTGKLRWWAGCVLAACLCPAALPSEGDAYRLYGYRQPSRVLTYYADARQYARAADAAARAWNASGVRFRFVKGSRARARLRIRYMRGPASEFIFGGFTASPRLILMPRLRSADRLDPDVAMAVIAHEMGHVLGLAHEDRRCALMNTSYASRCPKPKYQWQWRCRILERDDVAGAVALYGGRVRPVRAKPFCDRYPAPFAPSEATAAYDAESESIVVFWRSPRDTFPRYAVLGTASSSVQFAVAPDACPAISARADGSVPIRSGARQSTPLYGDFTPGRRYCVSLWTRDPLGRTSRSPATTTIEVTENG